ncbi:unnamed protein product, partial [Tuber aestivum]
CRPEHSPLPHARGEAVKSIRSLPLQLLVAHCHTRPLVNSLLPHTRGEAEQAFHSLRPQPLVVHYHICCPQHSRSQYPVFSWLGIYRWSPNLTRRSSRLLVGKSRSRTCDAGKGHQGYIWLATPCQAREPSLTRRRVGIHEPIASTVVEK